MAREERGGVEEKKERRSRRVSESKSKAPSTSSQICVKLLWGSLTSALNRPIKSIQMMQRKCEVRPNSKVRATLCTLQHKADQKHHAGKHGSAQNDQ